MFTGTQAAPAAGGLLEADRPETAGPRVFREDLALARLCLEGDSHAQAAFVERLSPVVWTFLRQQALTHADAEDLCQEVFADAFRALRAFRGECRLSTWIWTLARRRVADHFRSPQRRDRPAGLATDTDFPSAAEPPAAQAVVQRALETNAREAAVRKALVSLTEPARSILIAFYVGELPVAEIAAQLEMPEGTVKTHLHRGRQSLRQILEEQGHAL